jgi:hypothetical protein
VEEEDEWLIIEASLASTEVSAGAVAKADLSIYLYLYIMYLELDKYIANLLGILT